MKGETRFAGSRSDDKFHLSNSDFLQLTGLIQERTGLNFSPEKRREFQMKLSERLELTKTASAGSLIDTARESKEVMQDIVNCLTIGESYFFRNRPHFEALSETVFPDLIQEAKKERRLKIWCAGCATGEEPYSLAILLRERFPEVKEWDITITATDINTRFINLAKEGVYSRWSFRGVDEDLIWKYFFEENPNQFRLHADIRRMVQFRRFNLAELPYVGRLPERDYDLVMCRNVLIYFTFQFANEIIGSFADVTHPGSYLFVGHSEAFPALSQLDVIYSHATYYYRYHQIAGEQADRQSIAPGPTLSIPGIGVKTIVPKSPLPAPGLKHGYTMPLDGEERKPRSRNSMLREARDNLNITKELEQARKRANEGEIAETYERLTALAAGPGKLDYRVHFLRSIIADQAGRLKESVMSLKQAIFLQKSFVIGHFYLGVIHQREGQYTDSARCFRNARNLAQKLPDDHVLDEAEGLTAGRLKEIVAARFEEVRFEQGQ